MLQPTQLGHAVDAHQSRNNAEASTGCSGTAAATCHCPTGASCDNGTVVNRRRLLGRRRMQLTTSKSACRTAAARTSGASGATLAACARASPGTTTQVSRFGPYACPSSNGGRALVATSGLLLVVLAFVLLNQLVLPKHPSLQICFHAGADCGFPKEDHLRSGLRPGEPPSAGAPRGAARRYRVVRRGPLQADVRRELRLRAAIALAARRGGGRAHLLSSCRSARGSWRS